MRVRVPVDLLQVEERVLGPFDLRQSIALGTAGLLGAGAMLGGLPAPIALPLAAGALAYALLELDGAPLRRRVPWLFRYALRLFLATRRTAGEADPFPRSN